MPRICEFYGIAIYLYWADHAPPHFHAIYGEHEVLVRMADGAVLRGHLPRIARRLVDEWTALHREELMANWQRAQAAEPLVPIEPLR